MTIAIGTYVIARGSGSGVMCGELVALDGTAVTLRNARQMWRWQAAETGALAGCAATGVDPQQCRFSAPSESATMLDACQIIAVDAHAKASFDAVGW